MNRRRLHAVWAVALLPFLFGTSKASPSVNLAELAAEPTWLKLGHYNPRRAGPSKWQSAIHSKEFFLDPSGATDPLGELQATFLAFNLPQAADEDAHAQCKFPARLLWLKRRLGAQAAFRNDIRCPALESWTQSGTVGSISVVFATGFLGNPASYYGHTLLKLNFPTSDTHTRLLDVSVNYGAILEGKHDWQITYLIKSLSGQYDAGFSHIHFYFHEHNYGNHELRDLWEYQLDLPPEDIAFVVAHAWELLGRKYTYYFFRGNCAYRMAEVLEIVDGLDIIPRHRPWTIPQSLVQKLATARYRDRPLVADIIYHPSRQARFYEKFLSLAPEDQTLLRSVVVQPQRSTGGDFAARPLSSQQAILDGVLDYHQFVHNPIAKAPAVAKQAYADSLSRRFQLPPGVPQVRQIDPTSPDRTRPPGWFQFSLTRNTAVGNAGSMRVRPAYYDNLDYDSGHVRLGSLAMGDTQVEFFDERIRLRKLSVLHIESVNPGISGLPGDRGESWKLDVGAEQARLACRDCLVARAQVDVGHARRLNERLFAAAYIGGAIQGNAAEQGAGFSRASASFFWNVSPSLRTRFEYEYRLPLESDVGRYGVANTELRWAVGHQSDVRFSYNQDRARVFEVGYGIYW